MSLYIEKYRPKTREEIVGNQDELDRIFSVVKTKNIPHLIFQGPAGVGKTSTALVIARQLFGEFYKANFLELNASDERGINVVRDVIKSFCKTAPLGALFKILFLDEADNMTKDAQQALRRIMEKYSNVTRFILSVNHPEKLIEPITSRCETFRFGPLSEEDITKRIEYIVASEDLKIDEETVKTLAKLADGDMRKALNKLQVLVSYGELIDEKLFINNERGEIGYKIIQSLHQGRFLQARQLVKDYLVRGYTERNLINMIHSCLFHQNLYKEEQLINLKPTIKGECILALAEADYRLTQGVSKGLQLDALLLKLLKIMRNENGSGKNP